MSRDHVGYPLGSDTKIEGGSNADGDRHAVIVDSGTCRLYELFDLHKSASGKWTAGSGATWSLKSDALRPAGWTSADAAGLPILPGLLRYGEVENGNIDHAIRFTTNVTQTGVTCGRRAIKPDRRRARRTRRWARASGSRRATASRRRCAPTRKNVLQAMKTYGLVLADNGSPWYFQGTADTRWPSGLLDQFKAVPASAFEAVDTSSLKVSSSSARAR